MDTVAHRAGSAHARTDCPQVLRVVVAIIRQTEIVDVVLRRLFPPGTAAAAAAETATASGHLILLLLVHALLSGGIGRV